MIVVSSLEVTHDSKDANFWAESQRGSAKIAVPQMAIGS